MTPSMIARATRAGTIRRFLAMTMVMGPTQLALWSAMMALVTRLGWRPARSGMVAVTWTKATGHRQGTSSAWNFSWRLTRWAATRDTATRLELPISRVTHGSARLRKVARPTHYQLLWKLKQQLAS